MSNAKVNEKKIAIIGGGISGLISIATLKAEGFDPICFEKTDKYGGTWAYREESEVGVPSIMPTTAINSSKEISAFSNFPPKKEFSNYMRHFQLYQYIKEYCEYNDVLKHVRYSHEVIRLQRTKDYDITGRWDLTVKNLITNCIVKDIFDAVLCCSGHLSYPYMPTYPGQENFTGKIIHTHSLKGVENFKGQNVVVIGMGCSALDAAVDVSNVAKQTYLSTRSGAHVLPRVGSKGYPIDNLLHKRFYECLRKLFPTTIFSKLIEKFVTDQNFDQNMYGVKPNHRLLQKSPTTNDHIFSKLLTGSVKMRKNIIRITEKGVEFEDGSATTEVDTIIMATGYEFRFPFLEDGVFSKDSKGIVNTYMGMWPVQLEHPTFAMIGLVFPIGPSVPIIELQIRWAAHIFAERGHLPPRKKMLQSIARKHKKNVSRYLPNDHIDFMADYMDIMDKLASKIGAKPKLISLDAKLLFKLWFGPFLPYQYRLRGPHKWDGARKAILKCDERVLYPIQTIHD